jgi:hypothetical protein
MQPILTSVPVLAVSMIFCLWHGYLRLMLRRESTLRERVAYMLWVMATETD